MKKHVELCDADGVLHSAPFVRNPYNYNTELVSVETGLHCRDVSRTQQQFKEECDINVILERFGVTGKLPLTTLQPMVGDFTAVEDYQSALDSVRAANENFLTLPAKVRDRFNQDPRVFVDFCLDPKNLEAVRELGLAPRPPAPSLSDLQSTSTSTNPKS